VGGKNRGGAGCLRLPHQLNGYILLKARYKRHIAFANGAGNANAIAVAIAMANRRSDFRSFCGATERIRNAGAKCLEEPQWAGVSTPSVAITPVLTWHYPRPDPVPIPIPTQSQTQSSRPDPIPDSRPPQDGPDKRCYLFRICLPFPFFIYVWQTPIFMAVDAAQLRLQVGLLVAVFISGQQIWWIPRDLGSTSCSNQAENKRNPSKQTPPNQLSSAMPAHL